METNVPFEKPQYWDGRAWRELPEHSSTMLWREDPHPGECLFRVVGMLANALVVVTTDKEDHLRPDSRGEAELWLPRGAQVDLHIKTLGYHDFKLGTFTLPDQPQYTAVAINSQPGRVPAPA